MEKLGQTQVNISSKQGRLSRQIRVRNTGPQTGQKLRAPGARGNGAGPFQNDKIFDRTIRNCRAKTIIW